MTSEAHALSLIPEIFKSIRASRDVALTPDPASAFWQRATPIYIANDNFGEVVQNCQTEMRSRWTKNNLYILFICPYQKLNLKPNPSVTAKTYLLWNWDVVEVFIGSDFQNIRRYKEFELSPQGEWLDLDVNLDSPHHEDRWTWNSGFQVAARIDQTGKIWYGAMRIPFCAIDPQAPRVGTIFLVNLFRVQGPHDDQQLLAWQPTMSKTFHVPERFGHLVLTDSH